MSGDVSVRPAIPSDARAIAEIHVRTWQVAYRGLIPAAYLDGLDVDKREAMWRTRLDSKGHPSRCIWVATRAGRVIGFAITGDTRDVDLAGKRVGELYAIYVAADAWGHGAGRALMERAAADMAQQGYELATLWVLEGNDRTIQFYERNGWTFDGTRQIEEVGGADLPHLRYRCRLASG